MRKKYVKKSYSVLKNLSFNIGFMRAQACVFFLSSSMKYFHISEARGKVTRESHVYVKQNEEYQNNDCLQ